MASLGKCVDSSIRAMDNRPSSMYRSQFSCNVHPSASSNSNNCPTNSSHNTSSVSFNSLDISLSPYIVKVKKERFGWGLEHSVYKKTEVKQKVSLCLTCNTERSTENGAKVVGYARIDTVSKVERNRSATPATSSGCKSTLTSF